MGAVISGGLQVAGGIMGMGASNKAAEQQANALKQALQFQQQVYGTSQTNLNPYISGGNNALAAVSQLYGLPAPTGTNLPAGNAQSAYDAFTKTPFYQFPLQQGMEAVNRSGAARGLTLSGGQMNALQAYGQGYAGQNFQSYISALSGLANLGQTSGVQLGQLGNQAATNVTGIQTGIGNALAAGTIGAQKSLNSALSGVSNLINPLTGGGSFLSQGQSSANTLSANPFLGASDVNNSSYGGGNSSSSGLSSLASLAPLAMSFFA